MYNWIPKYVHNCNIDAEALNWKTQKKSFRTELKLRPLK